MRRKKKELLRAAIYARRTVDDKKSDSIQMQIETCQRHLEISRRDRIESVSLYIDEGFSRRNTNRPDWQRMMQDIEDGQLDLICVYRIDRISGNMLDFSMFHTKVVDDYGLELIAVREGIDSAYSITGNTMAYISATMATHEVKQDSIRSFDNSRNLAVHGFWSGGKPPLGYTLIPVTVNGKIHKMLELLPEDIEYKKNLVSLFLDNNFTLSSMEGYLKRNSIKTRNGKFFSTVQLHSLLTAPQCVENTPEMYDYFASLGCEMEQTHSSRDKWDGQHGIIVFGRTTEQKGRHQNAPPDEWLVCIGKHKPFMKAETFFRIRKQLDSHTFNKTSVHPPQLLKGALRCQCGSLMRVSYKRRVDGSYSSWYYCLNRMRKGKEYCGCRQIKTDILNNKVLEIFRNIQTDPAAADRFLFRNSFHGSRPTSASLRNRERSINQKVENLISVLAKNSDSSAARYIISEMERLDAELKECRKQILSVSASENKLTLSK